MPLLPPSLSLPRQRWPQTERSLLAVNNMDCAACPSIVKASLEAVPGVAKVAVSYKEKTATITYDDAKADVNQLTSATTQGRLSVRAQELIRCFFNRPSPVRTAPLAKIGDHADRCLSVLLRMHRLRHKAEAKVGRLLRVLFLRLGAVPADSGRARGRERRGLLLCGRQAMSTNTSIQSTRDWLRSRAHQPAGLVGAYKPRLLPVCLLRFRFEPCIWTSRSSGWEWRAS